MKQGKTKSGTKTSENPRASIRIERDLQENVKLLSAIVDSLSEGIAIHEIVFNDEGEAVDFIICEVNSGYEKITGLRKEEVTGRLATEVYNSKEPKHLGIFSMVASTGKPFTFEFFSPLTNKYYSVFVMSQEKGKFITIFHDITVQREKKGTLEESEKKYQHLLESAPTGIYEINFRTKKFVSVNDTMCRLTGYSRKELLTMNPMDILDNEGKLALQGRIRQWLSGEKPEENVEYRVVAKDGHIINALLNTKFTVDRDGNPIGATVVAHDITERKKAEMALRESEQHFKILFETMSQGAVYQDKEGKIISMNPAAQEILGKTPEEFIGSSSVQEETYTIKEDGSFFPGFEHPAMVSLKTGEKVHDVVMGVFNPKIRSYRWINVHSTPLFREGEKTPYQVYTTFSDITDRKNIENQLVEAKEKLDIALENGNIGVWTWNIKTDRIIWDERLERMFGLEPGTFRQSYGEFENLVNEEDLSHIRKAVADTLEKDLPYEVIFRTKPINGRIKYITGKAHVNKDETGDPLSFIGVAFDVSDLKESTDQLILKLNEELLRSNKELENFAYVASHDLQEPLRMVSSFTQLLSMQYKDKLDKKAQDYIQFAVDGARRMYDLINGLLAYSRINTRGNAFSNVNVGKVIDSVLNNLKLVIEERKVKVRKSRMPVIWADQNQMIQLFQNLISNSIKFSEGIPEISISYKIEKNNYHFSVSDKGIGIEDIYFDRVFLIFQRLMPRDQYEGTGIGLALCKKIIERHGGKIWIKSTPGKGSTFFFTIPVKNSIASQTIPPL